MLTILPRKFIVLLIFLLTLGSLGLWYFLSFSPPQNVQITDQTDNSAVVVWNTVKPSASNVYYSTHPLLLKFLPLTFLATSLARDHELTTNHSLVLTNLKPNQIYYLSLSNWFHFYSTQRVTNTGLNNGFWQRIPSVSLPTIKIVGSQPPKANSQQLVVSGIVTNNKLQPVPGAIVIAKTASGQAFSTLSDQKGNFSLNLSLTDKDHLVFFTGQNGVNQQKNIVVAREIINQPVLITLP